MILTTYRGGDPIISRQRGHATKKHAEKSGCYFYAFGQVMRPKIVRSLGE